MPVQFSSEKTGFIKPATVPMDFARVLFPKESAEFFALLATTNFALWFIYGGYVE